MSAEILVMTPDYPPEAGGIQILVHRIASSLRRHRSTVVTLASAGDRAFDAATPNVDVVRVAAPLPLRPLRIAVLNVAALRVALARRPRAILSAHIVTGPAALLASRLLRIPVVQYTHAQELNRRPRLARAVLRRAHAVVAVSRHTEQLALGLGARPGRVHVVHPGVDVPEKASGHATSDRRPWIVVVSRLEESYKGHDVLLRALPLVRSRVPDAELHIVGDGSLRPGLASLAAALGIDHGVTFHGRLADADRDELLGRAAVFAMPSRTDASGAGEGFGIVYLEAGAHGLPVVAGDVAGARDAVMQGETGLLVDPTDHVAVAEAVIGLLTDQAAARRMGEAGHARARALSWQAAADRVDDLLGSLVGAAR